MKKFAYLVLGFIILLIGCHAWQRQQTVTVRAQSELQWRAALKLHYLVHAGGVTIIEGQRLRTRLTPEYRQFLTDNLPFWEFYLHEYIPEVDALVAEFAKNATTMQEIRRRNQRLLDVESRVMVPWMRIAYAFPEEKVARE